MQVTLKELSQSGFIKGLQKDSTVFLKKAVIDDNWQEVQKLLNSSLNFNANVEVDQNGNTLLYLAAENGEKEIAELLIEKGADVNKENKAGSTPLHLAAENGKKEIAELLVRKMRLAVEIV